MWELIPGATRSEAMGKRTYHYDPFSYVNLIYLYFEEMNPGLSRKYKRTNQEPVMKRWSGREEQLKILQWRYIVRE